MAEQEKYECAVCGTLTTRINYEFEEPSCSIECDDRLDADIERTPADGNE